MEQQHCRLGRQTFLSSTVRMDLWQLTVAYWKLTNATAPSRSVCQIVQNSVQLWCDIQIQPICHRTSMLRPKASATQQVRISKPVHYSSSATDTVHNPRLEETVKPCARTHGLSSPCRCCRCCMQASTATVYVTSSQTEDRHYPIMQ